MTYEKKDGAISLFFNDKQGNEKRPDLKGTVLIEGKEYEVALWKKTSTKGTQFLSGNIKPAQEKKEVGREPETSQFNDEIPF